MSRPGPRPMASCSSARTSIIATGSGRSPPRLAANSSRGIIDPMQAIDCDVHPTVPDIPALLPYFDTYWRDSIEERGIASLDTLAYPPNAPITARPDWRGKNGQAATEVSQLTSQVLDR